MLPFLILLFCSSPETARMILIYATDESAARLQALEDFARLNDSGFAASAQTPYEWENRKRRLSTVWSRIQDPVT